MIRRWVAFWDRREAPTSLALVRILVGSVVIADLWVAWRLDLVPDIWVPPPAGLGYGASDLRLLFSLELFGASRDGILAVWIWTLLSALLLATGTLTRIAGWSLAVASAQLSLLSPNADRGIDDLLRIAAALLGVSGAGARWSVDAWIMRALKGASVERVPAWPRYLLLMQLLWVYSSAAQHRGDADWWPHGGCSALSKILSDPHLSRVPSGWLAPIYPFTQLATAATMLFEISAPLLLLWIWYERTPRWPGKLRRSAVLLRFRWIWITTGICFHLGIALTMRLGIFPFGVLALYPALFTPDEIRSGARWLAGHAPLPRKQRDGYES